MDIGTGKSLNITRANGIQYSSSIETALPPLEWLLTKQVDYAQRLLRNHNTPVNTEVLWFF
mgnify:CR=1 FL=1